MLVEFSPWPYLFSPYVTDRVNCGKNQMYGFAVRESVGQFFWNRFFTALAYVNYSVDVTCDASEVEPKTEPTIATMFSPTAAVTCSTSNRALEISLQYATENR